MSTQDEGGVGQRELAPYLERIGFARPVAPRMATLYRAHVTSIPGRVNGEAAVATARRAACWFVEVAADHL